MEQLSLLSTASPVNVAIICAAFVAAVFMITSKIKNLKAGKDGLEFNSQSHDGNKPIDHSLIITQMMDSTWKIYNEMRTGENFYKNQARKGLKAQLHGYVVLMKKVGLELFKEKFEDYKLAYLYFTSVLQGLCYIQLLNYMLSLYESNHISDLKRDELEEKSKEVYHQCSVIFRDYFQELLFDEVMSFEDLKRVSRDVEKDVIDICMNCLLVIQKNLKAMYSLRSSLDDIKNKTVLYLKNNSYLPHEAQVLLGGFFESNKGLNEEKVKTYLDILNGVS